MSAAVVVTRKPPRPRDRRGRDRVLDGDDYRRGRGRVAGRVARDRGNRIGPIRPASNSSWSEDSAGDFRSEVHATGLELHARDAGVVGGIGRYGDCPRHDAPAAGDVMETVGGVVSDGGGGGGGGGGVAPAHAPLTAHVGACNAANRRRGLSRRCRRCGTPRRW